MKERIIEMLSETQDERIVALIYHILIHYQKRKQSKTV